ncbi:glycosyltransferase family 39 protein [Maritalea mobilis]|uniref:ArnT family glycosyltransferase n=1 Tax=Maritalea mobilis TaxID=483324 RepID=UPI001C94526E|nr:glycosyltransferase family 39 protein [Maritalea mobilis]MBY6200902.1 glycosyltransferase family 39 protein [Maritalea mobilis]
MTSHDIPSARSTGILSRLAPLAVLLLSLFSFGVGLTELPVQDRDEARYAQASRQMAETGDWVDIRFQEDARHNKPAGVYWMQAAVLRATGQTGTTEIWVQRIPSYLSGALACLALIWAGSPLVGRRAAILSGVMLATVYMLHAEARTAKTDAALLLAVILAMGAMARAWLGADWLKQGRRWAVPAIFWTAMAAGLLIKGPMILLPVLGAAAWISISGRSLQWTKGLKLLPGLAWMLLLALPWFVAIMIRTEGEFLMASVGGDLVEKITAEGEHSGFPPGVYLVTMWFTLWPWNVLAPLAVVAGWKARKSRETAFLLGWLIPTWLVFEAVSTKLIHYTLPTYPALMLLAAGPLVAMIDSTRRFAGWPAHLGAFGFTLGTVFFVAIAFGGPIAFGEGIDLLSVAGGVALGAAAVAGLIWLYRGQAKRALASLATAGVMMGWTMTAVTLPALHDYWITPRLADAMAQHECLVRPISLSGYAEASTVFQFGRDTLHQSPPQALAWLAEGENRAAWIDTRRLPDGMDMPPEGIDDLTEIRGTNYTNGRRVHLRLYVSPGVPAPADPCAPVE